MADYKAFRIDNRDHVTVVWLNRPAKLNAMGADFFAELPAVFEAIGDDPDVRAVVMAAEGPHFSVGLDLTDLAAIMEDPPSGAPNSLAHRAAKTRRQILKLQRSISSVASCPVPVIAAIRGYCIGGGLDLASACDIRLASENAVFSLREAKMAMVADLGSLQRLTPIIGSGNLAELAYTAKDISSRAAQRIGLVNEVFGEKEALWTEAISMAEEIASNSPLATRGTKEVLRSQSEAGISRDLEFVATWNSAAVHSDDVVEAVMSFLEKRKGNFKGS